MLSPALLRPVSIFLFATVIVPIWTVEALAHASNRGHVLLLPTQHYLLGGALAVAASFLALALLQPEPFIRFMERRKLLFRVPVDGRLVVSTLSFLSFGVLIYAGFYGSRDPLANPL